MMESWYEENLICPIDYLPLKYVNGTLVSSAGKKYPVVDGVPVMLIDNIAQTMPLVTASLERAKNNRAVIDNRAPHLYLESLGMNEEQKKSMIQSANRNDLKIDPVVSYIIGATNGCAYKELIGKIESYPIPHLKLPNSNGEMLLDVGCNWGRWSIAAAKKGYTVVGIDPSLGAIMAARRVANQMGLTVKYIVGDARYLPFKSSFFNKVFSYSVLQHLTKDDVRKVLSGIGRVLKTNGISLIQMPNCLGIRSLRHQVKRRFRGAKNFEVRYWSIPELKRTFEREIGHSQISADCYFGLGLQKSDIDYMSRKMKLIITFSEFLTKISNKVRILKYAADSVYVNSRKS